MAEHTLDKPAEFLTSHQQRLSVTETEFFVLKNFYFKKDANQDGQKIHNFWS